MKGRSDWGLAPLAGVAFVALLLLVQWPFSSFLLTLKQPNYFFATGYWDYTARLGTWTQVFFDVPGYAYSRRTGLTGSLDVAAMAKALGIAVLFAMVSSRLGLVWGRWMTRVQR